MVDEIKPTNVQPQVQQPIEEKKGFFDKFKKKEEIQQPAQPIQSQVQPSQVQVRMEQPSKLLGIIGTVCGVLGLLGMFVMPFIGTFLGVAGLVLAILQIRKQKNVWAWIALGVSIVAILGSFGLVAYEEMFGSVTSVSVPSNAATLPVKSDVKNIVF